MLLAAVLASVCTETSAAGLDRREAPSAVAPTQELALLLSPHTARAAPSPRAAKLRVVAPERPLTGVRTTLPVLGGRLVGGSRWLLVRLPGRPNGGSGWIMRRGTAVTTTHWHLLVDTSARHVTVYERGRAVRVFVAVVGKPSTPTPRGHFFVEEAIALRVGDVGAPFAFALSARSNVLQEFDGGPGQIAIHGLANVGGVPGTAVSHGCVRLRAAAVRWLARRIGAGVPVTILG